MPNSKPWLDEALRDLYRQDHETCELWRHMEGESWERVLKGWPRCDWQNAVAQLHHIWSDRQRYDLESNYVMVCAPVHAWLHQYLRQGRVLCVWHKAVKGEFDLEAMRGAIGRCPLGVIENYPADSLEPWVLDLRMGLMGMF